MSNEQERAVIEDQIAGDAMAEQKAELDAHPKPEPGEITGPEQVSLRDVAQQVDDLWTKTERVYAKLSAIEHKLDKVLEALATGTKSVNETINTSPDSLTLGSPTNGQMKAYGDLTNDKEFRKKIENAQVLLKEAKEG